MSFFHRDADPEPDPDPGRFRELMVEGQPDFDELLQCVFGISEPVADVYCHLLDHLESTVKEIARALECDRSTVNRKLDTLQEKHLVTRSRDLLGGGGITYRYHPAPIDETRDRVHRTLDEWSAFMHDKIDDVPRSLTSAAKNSGRYCIQG